MLSIISKRIKTLRAAHAMNQTDFAQRIGISQPTLSCYEKGTAFPSIEVLINIALQFNVSLDWLCGISQEHVTISNLSDFIRCLFELDRTTDLRYEIEINDPRSNIDNTNNPKARAAIIFTKDEPSYPINADVYSFLADFQEQRQAFESYFTSKDQFEWWQKYALEKYNTTALTQIAYEEIPTERRIALRNALVMKQVEESQK